VKPGFLVRSYGGIFGCRGQVVNEAKDHQDIEQSLISYVQFDL
jgi:hypothetical protein